VICHYCKKPGHFIKDCRVLKKKEQANNVEENLVAVISEVNMVVNASGWWVDTGATRHICGEKNLFKTYEKVGDEIELHGKFNYHQSSWERHRGVEVYFWQSSYSS
jgi:hypothetical protein